MHVPAGPGPVRPAAAVAGPAPTLVTDGHRAHVPGQRRAESTRAHRVLVVDDLRLLAQSLAGQIAGRLPEGCTAAGRPVETAWASDPADALALAEQWRPDVVLLDLDIDDGCHGVRLVPPLLALGARLLLVSGLTDPRRVRAALDAGACGLLPKSAPLELVLAAIGRAVDGTSSSSSPERAWAREARRAAADEDLRLAPFDRLTGRERQVLRHLIDGADARSIAERWTVSEATVRTQIRGVLTKLGVGSQLAAVAVARRANWPTG